MFSTNIEQLRIRISLHQEQASRCWIQTLPSELTTWLKCLQKTFIKAKNYSLLFSLYSLTFSDFFDSHSHRDCTLHSANIRLALRFDSWPIVYYGLNLNFVNFLLCLSHWFNSFYYSNWIISLIRLTFKYIPLNFLSYCTHQYLWQWIIFLLFTNKITLTSSLHILWDSYSICKLYSFHQLISFWMMMMMSSFWFMMNWGHCTLTT